MPQTVVSRCGLRRLLLLEDALQPRPAPVLQLHHLRRIGYLGLGGFGAVSLERHTSTGQYFALKALSKVTGECLRSPFAVVTAIRKLDAVTAVALTPWCRGCPWGCHRGCPRGCLRGCLRGCPRGCHRAMGTER